MKKFVIHKYVCSMVEEFAKMTRDMESEKKNRRMWKLARGKR